MQILLVLATVFAAAYGWVEWKELRVGNEALPTTLAGAKSLSWKHLQNDDVLKIKWYSSSSSSPRVLVAYDAQSNLAGIKVAQPKTSVSSDYVGIYTKSGTFEEETIRKKVYYTSTVLTTPVAVLKGGGRRMREADEVALQLVKKRAGTYMNLDRDGCDLSKSAVEQSCQDGYGLVFSEFSKNSSCKDTLSTFFTVFDTEDTGDLMAFAFLLLGSEPTPNSYPMTQESLQVVFPNSPVCLQAAAGKGDVRALEVWLTGVEESDNAVCPSTSWVRAACQPKMRQMNNNL